MHALFGLYEALILPWSREQILPDWDHEVETITDRTVKLAPVNILTLSENSRLGACINLQEHD